MYRVYYIDQLVEQFSERFNSYYTEALATDFTSLSLPGQVEYVRYLFKVCVDTYTHTHTHIHTFLVLTSTPDTYFCSSLHHTPTHTHFLY